MSDSKLRILKLIVLGLLVLMSLAAGAAKVMQTPQEAGLFTAVGLSLSVLMPFGALQIIAAIFGAIPKTRKYGAAMMSVSFLVSAIMIFMSGNMMFGVISLIPACLAGLLVFKPA